MITLYLLDDNALVREALRHKVTHDSDIEVVGEGSTVAEALEQIPALAPQVAILDVLLPDGSGIDVCRRLRSEMEGLRCFMLTAFADQDALLAAVMAGASGFLLKDVRADVADAVRRVAMGESLLDPVARRELLGELRGRVEATHGTEQQVLDLVEGGLTDRQIGLRLSMPEPVVHEQVRGLLRYAALGRWLRRG